MVPGSTDRTCQAGTEWTHDQLHSAGFDSTYVEIAGGTHWNVIFLLGPVGYHDEINPDAYMPNTPAGVAVVRTILDAIDSR